MTGKLDLAYKQNELVQSLMQKKKQNISKKNCNYAILHLKHGYMYASEYKVKQLAMASVKLKILFINIHNKS